MTKNNNDDFDNLEKCTRPYDEAFDNWWKAENVGDSVAGYIVDVVARPAEGQFKAQRVITLRQSNGKLINVPIKRISFVLDKTDDCRLGDPLKVTFAKTLAPQQKGYKGTKIYEFATKSLEANAGNKTVLELDKIELAKLDTTVPEDDFDSLGEEKTTE